MEIEIKIFNSSTYTDYNFENEFQAELQKIGRNILAFNSQLTRERIGFRKKDMRVVNVKIDGAEIEDPYKFNDNISKAVVQATENLSLELYGLV
ncbi:hypothetical protein [Oceanobacillus manasiensis]|uniref:hypothetical protein n=1 Tax=Oceanobacillus manasiensis TaxID=586413 RepID=UPI0005AB4327|nr:hypothetical protein [Oceanobacillus manasiensis]